MAHAGLAVTTVRTCTWSIIAWWLIALVALYAHAYAQRDVRKKPPYGVPPLSQNATLSSVVAAQPMRAVGGVVLGLPLLVLAGIEPFRGRAWLAGRLAVVLALLTCWVLVIVYPDPFQRCPVDRDAQKVRHVASAAGLVTAMALWVWLQSAMSPQQHVGVRTVGVFMVVVLVLFSAALALHVTHVARMQTTFATLEATHFLLFLVALALLASPSRLAKRA